MKGASQRWSQMAIQDKQVQFYYLLDQSKFEELNQIEKDRYNKALVTWAMSNDITAQIINKRSSSTSKKVCID